MKDFRNDLIQILSRVDKQYVEQLKGLTEREILDLIEEKIVKLDEIDESMPFEVGIYELRDVFEERYFVSIDRVIPEAELKKLYNLLVDYKTEKFSPQ